MAPTPPPPDRPNPDQTSDQTDVNLLHTPILREKREPHDGYEPVPMWLVALFGALLFWGGWYLATYSGGWRWDMLDPDPKALYATGSGQPEKPVDPIVLGERLYRAQCVSCHQAMGQGQPGQYPPLAGSEWVLGPDFRLARIPLHGLEGPITVLGNTYNGNMPAFDKKLNDIQLAAILTYIRQAWGNTAPPVPVEVVAAARQATKSHAQPWKAEELLAVTTPDPLPTPAATQPKAK